MYSMDEGVQVAQLAAKDIEAWLWGHSETISVQNVESEPAFQQIDVDLIWTTQKGSYQIEIKGEGLRPASLTLTQNS